MSKLSNCLKMIYLLQVQGKIKAKELSELLEVKERMIRIYRDEIEKSGIIIESESGKYGGYSLDKKSLFPIANLTSNEREELFLALDKVSAAQSKGFNSELEQAILKLKSAQLAKAEEQKYIYYVNKTIRNPEYAEDEKFQKVKEAISKRMQIKIIYKALSTLEVSERIIEPYGMVFYNDFYYCIAYCCLRKEMRHFKLVRMMGIELLEGERFEIPKDFNLKMTAESKDLGLIRNRVKVKLKISQPYAHLIQESIWAMDQVIEINEDQSIIFSGTMSGNDSIKRWILQMGACVEVLEPETLKTNINDELEKMIKNFK